MRVLLLIVIGVLVYNSNDARFFISDQLNNASEIIRPDAQLNFRFDPNVSPYLTKHGLHLYR